MEDSEILNRIHSIVEAERELRRQMQAEPESHPDAAARLQALEGSLDQCWDLLRQRRAHEEFNQNPDDAEARPVQQVEGYLQ
ncbi:MAG: DUF2630 family protein [Friedmanniella sp.]|jgi:hypothetical protein